MVGVNSGFDSLCGTMWRSQVRVLHTRLKINNGEIAKVVNAGD